MEYNKNKNGAALIIAMLVVTAMTSIGFFVSRLNIRDTVQMTRLEQSMLAYYDAEAGIEQGLLMFRYDKNAETSDFATEIKGSYIKYNIDEKNVYQLKIWHRQDGDVTGTLNQDESIDYDISKLQGDISITCISGCDQFSSNPQLNSLEYSTFTNGTFDYPQEKGLLYEGNPTVNVINNSAITSDQILRLHAWGSNKSYTISSSDTTGHDKLDSGYSYIESVGTNGDTQRKLRIQVDRRNGSILPVFDFVLFGGSQTGIITP